jgi:muramidase (phage lysozyme)
MIQPFLDLIKWSEGTSTSPHTINHGYDIIVGGSTFTNYADHPRISVWLPNQKIYSTAAGAYQILAKYFDAYKKILSLPDFTPNSQDQIALRLIRECQAWGDVMAENIESAITKCSSRWASFPGAGYGQHEWTMEQLVAQYNTLKNATGGSIGAYTGE